MGASLFEANEPGVEKKGSAKVGQVVDESRRGATLPRWGERR
jgi:hypothetical protein